MSSTTAATGDVASSSSSDNQHHAGPSTTSSKPERQTIGGGGGKKWISATPDLDDYPDPPSSYPPHLYEPVNFPKLQNTLLLDAAVSDPQLPRSPVWVMRQAGLLTVSSLNVDVVTDILAPITFTTTYTGRKIPPRISRIEEETWIL